MSSQQRRCGACAALKPYRHGPGAGMCVTLTVHAHTPARMTFAEAAAGITGITAAVAGNPVTRRAEDEACAHFKASGRP